MHSKLIDQIVKRIQFPFAFYRLLRLDECTTKFIF